MNESLARKLDGGPTSSTEHSTTEVCRSVISSCKEAKGQDLKVLSMSPISDIAQYFIIVSGRSDRQVQGISNRILEDLQGCGGPKPHSVEGMERGHWVLIDLGEVVVHVFYEPQRAHYDLEGLWAKAPSLDVDRQFA